MGWKLAQSDNHKWEPEEAMASLTTVRLNFNSMASDILDIGEHYYLYTDSDRKMFKLEPNERGRKLSASSTKKNRCSMTYAHLGRELPAGRYFHVKGTKYEFKLEGESATSRTSQVTNLESPKSKGKEVDERI
jgi:hypothetical protein